MKMIRDSVCIEKILKKLEVGDVSYHDYRRNGQRSNFKKIRLWIEGSNYRFIPKSSIHTPTQVKRSWFWKILSAVPQIGA